jgi:triosephosphate isomerase
MKRAQIVAGNWKMNMEFNAGRDLAISIIRQLGPTETQVILCPPFIHLNYISMLTKGIANLKVGSQNCHAAPQGAYTGEVSVAMIKSVGAEYIILGHSERRQYFNETDEMLAEKVDAVLEGGLKPIFCCGEKLDSREAGKQEEVVNKQLSGGLFHLSAEQFKNVVIAYEPVWAIGTGKTASPQQAQDMHAYIRKLISDKYGDSTADMTTILYGGSVKPNNAEEIFKKPDVDGGLIGGASLKSDDFVAIVNSFPEE